MVRYFFFFFSSRRRHTRLKGDWSSEVCSPDLVGTAVEPLQALGEELDVTDSAGRKLDVPLSSVASGARAALEVARDLLASVEYRFHRAKVELAAINQWLHLAQKAPADLHVSGRAACLDEHLQLPFPRPVTVILERRRKAGGEIAFAALRAQAQVHAEEGTFRSHLGDQLEHSLREPREVFGVGGGPLRAAGGFTVAAVQKH